MDKGKIKNLIIIVLVIVNVFLLALVLTDRYKAASVRKAAWDELLEIFEANGIGLSNDAQDASATIGYSLRRDVDTEYRLASRLLGKVEREDLGGNIYCYSGEKGKAYFRGTGEFEVSLNPGAVAAGKDPIKTSVSVLKILGIHCDRSSAELAEEDNSSQITLTISWQDAPIYNAEVCLSFSGDSLIRISGRRVMDSIKGNDGQGITAETALMAFLRIVSEGGYICTEVTGLRCGYFVSVSVSGDTSLIPMWRVETDAGSYFLNGYTGKKESLP